MKTIKIPFAQLFVLTLALAIVGMTGYKSPSGLTPYLSANAFGLGSLSASVTATANLQSATCPADIIVNTSGQLDSGEFVSYATPAGMTCTPASGAFFTVGSTMVNCAPIRPPSDCDPLGGCGCSFKVTVFNVCLQNDTASPRTGVSFLQFTTGQVGKTDYRYTDCSGAFGPTVISGRASVMKSGSLFTGITIKLNDPFKANATVTARLLTPGVLGYGSAEIKPRGSGTLKITDRQIANSRCTCSPPTPGI